MAKAFLIRPATIDDAEAILRAHHDAVHSKGAGYTPEQIEGWAAQCTPEKIADQKKELADARIITYAAEVDGRLVGFGRLIPNRKEIAAVYVAPGPWQGAGSELLQRLEADARKLGLTEINCDSSLNAEKFYLKHGFTATERTLHHMERSGVDIPCVKMVKRLPP